MAAIRGRFGALAALTVATALFGPGVVPTRAAGSATGSVAPVLRPMLPQLQRLQIPFFLPGALPKDISTSLTRDHAQREVVLASRLHGFSASIFYSIAEGGSTFRVYLFKMTAHPGTGPLPTGPSVTLPHGMYGRLNMSYGNTADTAQLGPAVVWTFRHTVYTLSINHNYPRSALLRAAHLLIKMNAPAPS